MRRVLIIMLLLLLMYALQLLQVGTDTPFNPQSLATLGFVLLAAYTLGEITNAFGVPKITGYIITGIVFGPQVINLFSTGVVSDLKLINGLAVGLIALTAGGEMKVSGLKGVAKTLSLIVLIKGLLILLTINLTVFLARPLIPFLAQENPFLVLSVGMILGVLAMGTSPSVTIAVINETESRGRLSDLTLGLAVVKDVVMVILLAVGISLTRLYSAPGATFDLSVLQQAGQEQFLSILAGALIGAIIILYVRFVRAEMWLFIVGLILFATTAAERWHLEALLMFITAGFTVQNFSPYGDELIHPIERLSLPVYVVFFSIAGADLNLNALQQVWLITLILVIVRIGVIYTGTRVATALAKEPPAIRQHAWLGFISQAAVVLGLAIVVENSLPGLGTQIKTMVVATVALNLLLGPITFKVALSRVGETKEERDKRAFAPVPLATEAAEAASPARPAPLAAEPQLPLPNFSSPELNRAARQLGDTLAARQREFEETAIDARREELAAFVARLQEHGRQTIERLMEQVASLPRGDRDQLIHLIRESRTQFSRWLLRALTELVAGDEATVRATNAFRDLFQAMGTICDDAPRNLVILQEPERFLPTPSDSFYVNVRKRFKRWFNTLRRGVGIGAGLKRVVLFRRLAKYHLAGTLPLLMLKVANLLGAQTLLALKKMRALYSRFDENYESLITFLEGQEEGLVEPLDLRKALATMSQDLQEDFNQVASDVERHSSDIKRQVTFAVSETYGAFLKHLEIAGTFELPRRRFRYSKVYEKSQQTKRDIARALALWRTYDRGLAGAFGKHIEVIMLMDNVSRVVDETVFNVLESMDEKLVASLLAMKEQCERSSQRLADEFASTASLAGLKQEMREHQETLSTFVQHHTLRTLSHLRESRELHTLIDVMLRRFAALADQMPEACTVLDEQDLGVSGQDGATPPDVKLSRAPLREITRSYLETEIARDLANVNRLMFEQVDETIQAVTEVYQFVNFNLKTAVEELDALTQDPDQPDDVTHPKELALGSLHRATARLETTLHKTHDLKAQVYEHIITHVDDRMREVETLILKRTTSDIQAHLRQRKAIERGFLYLRVVRRWLLSAYRKLRRQFRPLGREMVKDLKTTLGLQPFTPEDILAIYDQAKLDSRALASLPFIYQKLFDLRPLETSDFLVARREERRMVETATRRWQQGIACSIAVVGEIGSGKTSFINAMLKDVLSEYPVYKKSCVRTISSLEDMVRELSALLGFPNARDFDDLQAELEDMTENIIVVLEDAHQLYLRTLGGFEGLRRLLLLIARTSHKVLWVVSMREYPWRYLDHVLHISDYFTFVINTENVSRDELEQIILSRHKVSGFDWRFLPSEAMKQKKKYRKASEPERQHLRRREFFDELSQASEGNILTALFYWLRSVAEVQGNHLIISPLQRLDFDFLRDMPIDKLLTLGMISQHGNLTAAEHGQIFGTDLRASLATLTYLTNINLLTRESGEDNQDRFAINRLIYKPIARELRARNILH